MSKHKRKLTCNPLIAQIKQDKKAYTVYAVLQLLILGVIVLGIFNRRWENVFTGVLATVLLLIPPFVEKSFHVDVPTTLEILAYLFVFASAILGEIGDFYTHIPFWDTMLHTFNGFMFAAFGFCLVDIFNKSGKLRFTLSPIFLAIVAFCFSMTIGVLWEFFEYGADLLLHTDMQKDTALFGIHTVTLPNTAGVKVTHVPDIVSSVIITADGTAIPVEGYLDIGLVDTMADLFVNFIGAIIFSVIGYFYIKRRGKGRVANHFIPVFRENEDTENAGKILDAADED